jgi:UDP-GlcNAc3NAcA epimerase
MIKIMTIIGARPQFIKAAAVSRAFKSHPEINEIIVHTGQHFDKNMSDVFFEEMDIPKPAYNLQINGLNHGAMTGQMLEGIEKIILTEKPNYVMVYGDTNSTIAGALAAKKLHYKVIHVEAGLRSFNMAMPEEINRILTDRISDLLFCPTDAAIQNLNNEGFNNFNCKIHKTGDVMEDAARFYASIAQEKSSILKELSLNKNQFVLATVHRAENTDIFDNLIEIIRSLNQIAKEIDLVVPLHPRTKKIIVQHGIETSFKITDPLGYFDMINLLQHCRTVITDSGGLQKEAFFFRKYCITMREQTEWIELIDNGYNFLAGTNYNKIIDLFNELKMKKYPDVKNLYGNGEASKNICEIILNTIYG